MPSTRDYDLWPLLEHVPQGVLLVAANPWRVERANAVIAEWLQQTPGDLVGRPVEELFQPHSRAGVLFRLNCALRDNDGALAVPFLLSAGGGERRVGLQAYRIAANADVFGVILHSIDRTFAPSRIDPLTGQLDRKFLEDRLTALLHFAQYDQNQFAVLFVDLDNFKDINDRHGHLVGDQVLREAASRLADAVRAGDHVVRYGGDEFVALVEHVIDPTEIDAIIERIHRAMTAPIVIPDDEVRLTLSVGFALGPSGFKTPDEILAAADRAMYAAKRK
jgi:diguanylate cyclase (GGDEF)-like protein